MLQRRWCLNCVVSFVGYSYPLLQTQKRNLVNVKLKWVKDAVLDTVVSAGVQLKATSTLVSLIGSHPDFSLPVYFLSRYRGQLGLPSDLKVSTFIRRYPNIFQEFYRTDSGGTPVPWYKLAPEALDVYSQEMRFVYEDCYVDILNRLQKLLMLTKERLLPLQTIDQLRWDLGLPYDYENKLIAKHPELFSIVKLPDDRVGVKLLVWDDCLALSNLEFRNSNLVEKKGALAFPIRFTRGFGLKKKCMEWLNEWQKLPYTSPYVDASHLDPRTDVSEKRIVGVFHELLHLTILQRMERKNVSNMRGPLAMPQREAYDRGELIERHPLADIREKYATMMKKGFLDRSRGLYKEERGSSEDDLVKIIFVAKEVCMTLSLKQRQIHETLEDHDKYCCSEVVVLRQWNELADSVEKVEHVCSLCSLAMLLGIECFRPPTSTF
ncbi:UNVERIFIED_CONTAM: protein WHAT'S THIS FACTOR 9, mitochondrial [Sesamum calycinum]|uniref:Protein WHAT'S THIS FACTOR 9, mitochondrial n=1 Tax=Sesamum calycinum TaxID=2727403 RepID=A0AAW2LY74_9LAMI